MSAQTEQRPSTLDRLFWRIFLTKLWRLPVAVVVVWAAAAVQRFDIVHASVPVYEWAYWFVPTGLGVVFGLLWSVVSALKTRLRWEAELLAHLVGDAHDVLILRERERFWYISPQIKALTGYDAEVFRLTPEFFESLIHPEDLAAWQRYQDAIWRQEALPLRHQYEFRLRTPHRGLVWVRHQVSCFAFHGLRICRCVLHDITEQVELKRLFNRLQHEDVLTGLPNRQGLIRQCSSRLTPGAEVTFAVIDVVDLRRINLHESVAVGDRILMTVAVRLQHWIEMHTEAICVGRLVGDNFLVVASGSSDAVQALLLSEREGLEQPYYADAMGRYVPFRLGFGFYTVQVENPDDRSMLETYLQAAYLSAH